MNNSCHIGEYKVVTRNKTLYVDDFHNCSIHKCLKNSCIFNNLIFEFQGNYFHGNKFIYNMNDTCFGVPYYQIWQKDKIKQNSLEKKKYKVIYIWENFIDDMMKILLKK